MSTTYQRSVPDPPLHEQQWNEPQSELSESTLRGSPNLPDHPKENPHRRVGSTSESPRSGWRCSLSTTQHRLRDEISTWTKRRTMRQPQPQRAFFLARARCLSAGLRYLRLTRLPRHDRGPAPGGNRSAASCLCTVLRRALYHYATRSPDLSLRERSS